MQTNASNGNGGNDKDNDDIRRLLKPQKQQCPICLDDLLCNKRNSNNESSVGALVPCGHCMHSKCYRQWKNADYSRRRVVAHEQRQQENKSESQTSTECICPICNAPATTFVTLFLDTQLPPAESTGDDKDDELEEDEEEVENESTNHVVDQTQNLHHNGSGDPIIVLPQSSGLATRTASASVAAVLQELLTNQERMKAKLKRYKRRNKNLQQELQTERKDMEEMLLSTIQQFYKIMDNHDEERQRWTQGALQLRRELDATKEKLHKERQDSKQQREKMEQDVAILQQDCNNAQEQVIKATKGLEELKLHHQRKRQSKASQLLVQQNAQLVRENHNLKQAMFSREESDRARSKRHW